MPTVRKGFCNKKEFIFCCGAAWRAAVQRGVEEKSKKLGR
jgi:hypothetical protein